MRRKKTRLAGFRAAVDVEYHTGRFPVLIREEGRPTRVRLHDLTAGPEWTTLDALVYWFWERQVSIFYLLVFGGVLWLATSAPPYAIFVVFWGGLVLVGLAAWMVGRAAERRDQAASRDLDDG